MLVHSKATEKHYMLTPITFVKKNIFPKLKKGEKNHTVLHFCESPAQQMYLDFHICFSMKHTMIYCFGRGNNKKQALPKYKPGKRKVFQ